MPCIDHIVWPSSIKINIIETFLGNIVKFIKKLKNLRINDRCRPNETLLFDTIRVNKLHPY